MATSSLPNPPTAGTAPGAALSNTAGQPTAATAESSGRHTQAAGTGVPLAAHDGAEHAVTGPAAGAGPKPVLALVSGASFLAVLDTTVVNVALPNLHSSFTGASLPQLTWIITAYAVMFAALLPATGRLADVIGRRRLFLYAVIGSTVTSPADGAAPNVDLLIVFRAVQGLMAAGTIPASLALILAYTPAAHRTAAVGTYGAISSLAAAIGPSIGAVLAAMMRPSAV